MNKSDRDKQEQATAATKLIRDVLIPAMVPASIQEYIKRLEVRNTEQADKIITLEAQIDALQEQIDRLLAESAHA